MSGSARSWSTKLAPGCAISAQRNTSRRTGRRAATSGIVWPPSEWPTTTTSPSLLAEGVDDDRGVVVEQRVGVLAGEVDRHDAVAAALELGRQALPAPAAVPGAVDEGERAHGRASLPARRATPAGENPPVRFRSRVTLPRGPARPRAASPRPRCSPRGVRRRRGRPSARRGDRRARAGDDGGGRVVGGRPAPRPPPRPRPQVVMVRRAGGVPAGMGRAPAAHRRRDRRHPRDPRPGDAPRHREPDRPRRVRRPARHARHPPARLRRVLPAADRRLVRRLGPGEALLSRSSARLRHARAGTTLTLAGGRRLRVAGVVDDGLVRSAELVVSATEGARLAARAPYLLAAVAHRARRPPRRPGIRRRRGRGSASSAPRRGTPAASSPGPSTSSSASASSRCGRRSAPTGSRPTRRGSGATSAAPGCRSSAWSPATAA